MGSMAYPLGTRRGLDACSTERGTFAILALDHRQNLRRELQPADPASLTVAKMVEFKRAVVRCPVPWGLLSGDVGDRTFERQVAVACEAGASGVLAGRSVWDEAATMPAADRDAFLVTTARERPAGLADMAEALSAPWRPRWNAARRPDAPAEGWYAAY
jgi:tagatose-1,6-bisphosphate aldolase